MKKIILILIIGISALIAEDIVHYDIKTKNDNVVDYDQKKYKGDIIKNSLENKLEAQKDIPLTDKNTSQKKK